MLKNYIKATLRHIQKNVVNFLFKLGGLTLALFSLLVIILYVSFQLSFDKYHNNFNSIYRLNSNRDEDGELKLYATVPPGIGYEIKAEFPEVKSFARINEPTRALIKYDNKLVRSRGFVEADSSIFRVLTCSFIEGDKSALTAPGSIVLTESLANQIFGNNSALGRQLVLPEKENQIAQVTAVIEDLPPNTHLEMKAIVPMKSNDSWQITWDGSVYLFVMLNQHVNPDHLLGKINALIKRKLPQDDSGKTERFSLSFQRISDIYLAPAIEMEFFKKGNILYVYIFSLLGIFLLTIASINYINLSIADYYTRKREMGIRKILGVKKSQLKFYFITETLLICFAALILSVLLLYLLSPKVLPMVDTNLEFAMLFDFRIIIVAAITVFLLTVFSAVYPSVQISTNSPITDLHSDTGFSRRRTTRKSLLLVQFIVSTICMTGTFVVSRQIEFIQTKNVGYDRHNIVSLILPEEAGLEKSLVLKNELNKLTGVLFTSYAYYHVTGVPYFKSDYEVEVNNTMKSTLLAEVFVDHDYLQTMGIKLLAGRNFDVNNYSDSTKAFIVNETAAKEFDWIDPLGKRIRLKQNDSDLKKWDGTVIGVVQDFNTRSFRDKIEPLVMRLPFENWPGYCLNVRIRGDIDEAIPLIKSTFEKTMPGFLADIRIVEDMFNDQYREEDRIYSALLVCTWEIVFISALGIFSLSLYMSLQRMKEFGIRKVLGASSLQIGVLHAGSFIRLGLYANVISLPFAYWLATGWLEQFAFRTVVDGFLFLNVTAVTIILVLVSAGYSSIRAGKVNPVNVIKGTN